MDTWCQYLILSIMNNIEEWDENWYSLPSHERKILHDIYDKSFDKQNPSTRDKQIYLEFLYGKHNLILY